MESTPTMDMVSSRSKVRTAQEVGRLLARHVFLPINAIIFAVVVLLVIFGDAQNGIFLGAIVVVNICLGFGQDLRAWIMLERLQIATAPRVVRVGDDGSQEVILLDQIQKGDVLQLKLGDQVPCDGVLIKSSSIEVNEGLLTGESDSFERKEGDDILGGSVVTSGHGLMQAKTRFAESMVAKMTAGLKRYSANPSPIQISIQHIITYTVYALLASIAFLAVRGIALHLSTVLVVQNVGALASVLVPQGLVVSVTLLFTFGAAHFYRRNVLLQEVNATEKFGHIKNLCMDKTGTLTESTLSVKDMLPSPSASLHEARSFSASYIEGSGDSSQGIKAITTYLGSEKGIGTSDALSFSSWRQYGGVVLEDGTCILAGAPEVFVSKIENGRDRQWLEEQIQEHTRAGQHVLGVVKLVGNSTVVPHSLEDVSLTPVALFILGNHLREGIQDAVNFFQDRGVIIRILSGDNPETAQAIAKAAGVNGTERMITGKDMEGWDAADYARHVDRFRIFARIKPEQKERIVEALRQTGFTAMVGDGANDALSLKKADLGVAMADGSQAARQIAAVVLMGNSFTELPGGVRLADRMIENIEIFASIFINQTFVAFFLFATLIAAGFNFPLTPLNISFINYFAVGLPGMLISWWAINPPPHTLPVSKKSFLRRVLPLPLALSVVQTVGAIIVFWYARMHQVEPASLLIITFVVMAFFYFILTPKIYTAEVTLAQQLQLTAMGLVQLIILFGAFHLSWIQIFFNLSVPSAQGVQFASVIAIICGALLFIAARIVEQFAKA